LILTRLLQFGLTIVNKSFAHFECRRVIGRNKP
jgi:hypothetical protein